MHCKTCGRPLEETYPGRPASYLKSRKFCAGMACQAKKPKPWQRGSSDWKPRFWAKVNKQGPTPSHVPELGPCWVWTGATKKGYGYLQVSNNPLVQEYAYRLSWLLYNGEIPDGLSILHKCDNPLCVNPDHLRLGTRADNARDRDAKGRGKWAKGAEASNAKLSEIDVAAIRRRWKNGESQTSIASDYPVTQTQISRIVRGTQHNGGERMSEVTDLTIQEHLELSLLRLAEMKRESCWLAEAIEQYEEKMDQSTLEEIKTEAKIIIGNLQAVEAAIEGRRAGSIPSW